MPYLEQELRVSSETFPIMLLVDGEDDLIADDFEVDVHDFEHGPEWVKGPNTQ